MSIFSYKQIKKEVIAEILGSPLRFLGGPFRKRTPYPFKRLYYDQIADENKKEIVRKVILDILTTRDSLSSKRLRCFAAYIASDIGLMEAKPIVEKMASDRSLQEESCLLLMIERALEKFNSEYRFSYEQVKKIVICLIGGKYVSWYFQGGFPYDFKRFYYNEATNVLKKEIIRRVLIEILTDASTYSCRVRSSVAYIASDIGLI